jgi:hypothetical protein
MEIRKLEKNKSFLTQQELNDLYLNPEFDIVGSYVLVIKSMFFTAMYLVFLPWGTLVNILSFSLLYWIYKVKIIYNFSLT